MAYLGSLLSWANDRHTFGTTQYYGDCYLNLSMEVYYDSNKNKVGFLPTLTYRIPGQGYSSNYILGNSFISVDEQSIEFDPADYTVGYEYGSSSGALLSKTYNIVRPEMQETDAAFRAWYDTDYKYNAGFDYKDTYTVHWKCGGMYENTFTINVKAMLDEKYARAVMFSYPPMSDFLDSTNPTINYTVYDDTLIEKIELALSFDGTNDDIAYREISYFNYGANSYVFRLTDEERELIWAEAYNTYRLPICCLMRYTTTDGVERVVKTSYYHVNIQGEAPTVDLTAVDINPTTLALTGQSNYMVRGYSIARIEVNAVPSAGAQISSSVIYWGSTTEYAESAEILCETTGQISCRVIDSRDNVVTDTYRPVIKDYINPTIKITDRVPPNGETGIMTFTVSGDYWNQSFGAVHNSLTIQYRYKEYDVEDYSDWISLASTKVNIPTNGENRYSATGEIPGLDYTKAYQIQVRAVDKLAIVSTHVERVINTPVFDWSREDFKINVPTTINGWDYASNVVLWESDNGSQMDSTHTAYLNWPLQYVAHGIVLIFSAADSDVSWSTHFVPKEIISRNQGGAQCFMMANNAGFATVGAKYLYIYDDMIKGHSSNNTTGTAASNIKFNNAAFVLRAVIGV